MNLWPVEHFCPPFFSRSVLIWKKTGDKSVQLVRGSFLSNYFLKIHTFVDYHFYSTTFDIEALVDSHVWISEPKFPKDPSVWQRNSSRILHTQKCPKCSNWNDIDFMLFWQVRLQSMKPTPPKKSRFLSIFCGNLTQVQCKPFFMYLQSPSNKGLLWADFEIWGSLKQRPDQYKMKILVFSIQYDF